MLRSSRFARSSCAATIRRRDSLRSLINRTLRSTRPACDATSRTSCSFAGFIGSPRGHPQRDRPELLTLVDHREHVDTGVGGCLAGNGRSLGPDRGGHQSFARLQQDHHLGRARARAQQLRHAGKHVVGRVRLAQPFGEVRQHLVRRGTVAVHDPVGEPSEPCAGPERTRARRRIVDEELPGAEPAAAADAHDQHRQEDEESAVERREDRGDHGEHQRLLHHDAEVVQAVLQHRHADRDGHADARPPRAGRGTRRRRRRCCSRPSTTEVTTRVNPATPAKVADAATHLICCRSSPSARRHRRISDDDRGEAADDDRHRRPDREHEPGQPVEEREDPGLLDPEPRRTRALPARPSR